MEHMFLLRKRQPALPFHRLINILIIGDGWRAQDKKEFLRKCNKIVRYLYHLEPFNLLKKDINIFIRFRAEAPGVPKDAYIRDSLKTESANAALAKTLFKVYYKNNTPTDTQLYTYAPEEICRYVSNLVYRDKDTGTAIWGEDWLSERIPNPDDTSTEIQNISWGLICILMPNRRSGGAGNIKYNVTLGAKNYHLNFFAMDTNNHPAKTFTHELGHNLGLDDEYERDEVGAAPPFKYDTWTHAQNHKPPTTGPNIILQQNIRTNPFPSLFKGLTHTEIKSLPWFSLMTARDYDELLNGRGCICHPSNVEHIKFKIFEDPFYPDYYNNIIPFCEEDLGPAPSLLSARLNPGIYTLTELCGEVKRAMEDAGSNTYQFDLTHDYKFRFTTTTPGSHFSLFWAAHPNGSFAEHIGFDYSVNNVGNTSYTGNNKICLLMAGQKSDPDTHDPEWIYHKFDPLDNDYHSVRLFEGAYYTRTEVFRSNLHCIMRDLTFSNVRFCKACCVNLYKRLTTEPMLYSLSTGLRIWY